MKKTSDYRLLGYVNYECSPRYQGKITSYARTLTRHVSNGALLQEKTDEGYEYHIRQLTGAECFRLMGLTEEDAEKAMAVGVSESQIMKQAGNGICTNCVELIFRGLEQSSGELEEAA